MHVSTCYNSAPGAYRHLVHLQSAITLILILFMYTCCNLHLVHVWTCHNSAPNRLGLLYYSAPGKYLHLLYLCTGNNIRLSLICTFITLPWPTSGPTPNSALHTHCTCYSSYLANSLCSSGSASALRLLKLRTLLQGLYPLSCYTSALPKILRKINMCHCDNLQFCTCNKSATENEQVFFHSAPGTSLYSL